jgi:hypothetical protein
MVSSRGPAMGYIVEPLDLVSKRKRKNKPREPVSGFNSRSPVFQRKGQVTWFNSQ